MSIDGVDDELRPKCCPVHGGQEHRRHPKRKSRNGELDVRVRSYTPKTSSQAPIRLKEDAGPPLLPGTKIYSYSRIKEGSVSYLIRFPI